MDWFTILMIIIFFVAPVIQQILEAKKKKEAGTVEPLEIDGEGYRRMEVPLPAGSAGSAGSDGAGRRPSAEEPSWSDGWDSWPGAQPAENERRAEEGRRVVVQLPTPRPRAFEVEQWEDPEVIRRQRTLEKLESLEVRPLPAPPQPRVPTPAKVRTLAIAPAPRTMVTPPPRPHRAPARHTHMAMLRSGHPQDLRDMIVVSEILSPPKGLRDLE